MEKKEIKLEEGFTQLEDIIQKLEHEDISLEDSFALYSEGMKVLRQCNDSIDKVEKKLIILNENGEEYECEG